MKTKTLWYLLTVCLIAVIPYIATAKNTYSPTNGKYLQIIENKGQVTDQYYQSRYDIDAKIEGNNVLLFIGDGQLHYQWIREKEPASNQSSQDQRNIIDSNGSSEVLIYRMDVVLLGANKNAKVLFEEPTGYTEHYYKEHTKEVGVHVSGYSKIIYKNIYPNIDWVLYTTREGKIKYDFIVRKGGNIQDIQLEYKGATDISLKDGALIATTQFGTLTEAAPYSYELETGREIQTNYHIVGNILYFNTAAHEGTLVIDPELNWATYYGGSATNSEEYSYVTSDKAGNAYLWASTRSTTNIATTGAHQTAYSGNRDAFLAKFNISGTRVWSSYYGGSNVETPITIAADDSCNIYVGGLTESTSGIATSGSYQTTLSTQGNDGFLVKFDSSGSRKWGTYYDKGLSKLALDAYGHIYFTTSNIGAQRISKFSVSGQYIWDKYSSPGAAFLTLDQSGKNIYITGNTTSDTGVATTGAPQTTRGGNIDAVLYKFDTSGQKIWGTYYGGGNDDFGYSVSCFGNNEIYISGWTRSTSNIASTGAHKSNLTGVQDGFISKYNAQGASQWGTYFGGSAFDQLIAVRTLSDGSIYIYGTSNSTNGIATTGAHKTSPNSGDAILVRFNRNGQQLSGTYFGGNNNDGPLFHDVMSIYNNRYIYLSGITASTTGLATTGAYQTTIAGNTDNYLALFEIEDTTVFIQPSFLDTFVCKTDTLLVPFGVTRNFNSNNTFTIQLSNSSGSFTSPATLASLTNTPGGDTVACYIPPSVASGTGYRIRVVASSPADTSFTNLEDIAIYGYPANFSASSNTPICTGDSLKLNSNTTTNGVTYSWAGPQNFTADVKDTAILNTTLARSGDYYITIDNNGCMVKDTLSVSVNQTPENVAAATNGPLCTGDTMMLSGFSSTSGVSYKWSGAANYNVQNVNKPNVQLADSGTYVLTATLGNCSDTAMVRLEVAKGPTVAAVASPGTTVCEGELVTFAAFVQDAGTSPAYQWILNGIDVAGANNPIYTNNNIKTGDVVRLRVTPSTNCGVQTSSPVVMIVDTNVIPSVSISVTPSGSLYPNEPFTFTATPTNGGVNPTYQWKRNGTDITGATSGTWGANANQLDPNDEICVVLYSDEACPEPDTALSNCIKMQIRVSVEAISGSSKVKIYPNPANNRLTVEGIEEGTIIELYDIVGKKQFSTISDSDQHQIQLEHLASGIYLLYLSSEDGSKVSVKVRKE